jgi:type IV secretion system protein VirD4
MLEKGEQEQRGVRSSVNARLKPFTEPLLAAVTKDSTFCLKELMGEKTPVSLYLVVPPSDIARLMPLVRMIIELLTMRNMEEVPKVGSPKKRLLFLLDEFPALGKVEIFEKALAYMAGYGMQALIITQDKSQIDSLYTANNTIIGNCHIRVVYAPNDFSTADWISDMLGFKTVVQEDNSVSGGRGAVALDRVSISQMHTKRALMLPDEVMRLPGLTKNAQGRVVYPGEKIIFVQGKRPIRVCHVLYFTDRWFKERARYSAPSHSDGEFSRRTAAAEVVGEAI